MTEKQIATRPRCRTERKRWMKRNRRDRLYDMLLYVVFAFYIVFLGFALFRTHHSTRSLNLIPFQSITAYLAGGDRILSAFALSNVLGNIALFIPLGAYIFLFRREKRVLPSTLWVVLVSLTVEVVQYISKMGIGDIDDVILNGLGGFIGAVACKLVWNWCRDAEQLRRVVAIGAPVGAAVCFGILFLYNR